MCVAELVVVDSFMKWGREREREPRANSILPDCRSRGVVSCEGRGGGRDNAGNPDPDDVGCRQVLSWVFM